MASEMFKCCVCPAATRTAGEVKGEKPVAVTVTVYWPGARPETTYCPEASDVPVRLTPAADVTVNEAWGITAPLGSATWPRSVPTAADPAAVCAIADCRGLSPTKTRKV